MWNTDASVDEHGDLVCTRRTSTTQIENPCPDNAYGEPNADNGYTISTVADCMCEWGYITTRGVDTQGEPTLSCTPPDTLSDADTWEGCPEGMHEAGPWPVNDMTGCACNWGWSRPETSPGVVDLSTECIEDDDDDEDPDDFECPENSYGKGPVWPAENIDMCQCNYGYVKVNVGGMAGDEKWECQLPNVVDDCSGCITECPPNSWQMDWGVPSFQFETNCVCYHGFQQNVDSGVCVEGADKKSVSKKEAIKFNRAMRIREQQLKIKANQLARFEKQKQLNANRNQKLALAAKRNAMRRRDQAKRMEEKMHERSVKRAKKEKSNVKSLKQRLAPHSVARKAGKMTM